MKKNIHGSNENPSRQIKLGAAISYFSIVFNIVAGLLYIPWLVNHLGQSDYGLYSLSISVIGYFLIDFGLNSAIARFISKYRAEGNEDQIAKLLGITYKLYLGIDVVIFFVFFIILFFVQDIFVELTLIEIERFRVVFGIAAIFNLISFPFMPLNGILISFEKFVPLKSFDLAQRVLSIFTVYLFLSLGYGLYALVMINALVNISVIMMKLVYVKKQSGIIVDFSYRNKLLLYQIFRFSSWMTIISISQRFILNITPILLGIFSGTNQIAVFSIGMSIEGYVWTFAAALNGLFLPKVTRLVAANDDHKGILPLMIKVGRIQLIIIGLIYVGLITMGKEFLYLWIGEKFADSYYVIILLVSPGMITLTQEIAFNYLIVVNEVRYRAFSYMIAAMTSIVFSLFLTPKLGAIGAAIAIFIGLMLGHVIALNIIYHVVFKLDMIQFFLSCHRKFIFPIILSIVFGVVIQSYFPPSTSFMFVTKAIVLGFFYILMIWFLSMNEEEKNLFYSILKYVKRMLTRH